MGTRHRDAPRAIKKVNKGPATTDYVPVPTSFKPISYPTLVKLTNDALLRLNLT